MSKSSIARSMAGTLASIVAAGMLMAPAPDARAASATLAPATMQSILKQRIADFAAREQVAPPAIKSKLAELRQALGPNPKFTVGYTTALDIPLEQLAATKIPQLPPTTVQQINARGGELMKLDLQSAKLAKVDWLKHLLQQCSASASSFDWRKKGKVTPVKAQICGTCWDFTAMGAYEGSYAIRNNQLVDTSEQHVLNCASAGTCAGGWYMPVFDFLIAKGTATEAATPFTGNDGAACPMGVPTPFRATSWAFVGPNISTIPSVAAIKGALCQHGPLATAVWVDPPFQAYTGGVFDEHTKSFSGVNHGVVIIGWDDAKHAWLIKNSWGTGWGSTAAYGSERGYMWIDYNTNNIGRATAWVDAKSAKWMLIADYNKLLLSKYRIGPIPEETPVSTQPLKLKQVKPLLVQPQQ
jgi:C1A family cysteine protease